MIKKETKKEKKYLIDVSKLIFGGMVLALVLQINNLSKTGIMLFGIIVTLLPAIARFNLINENN